MPKFHFSAGDLAVGHASAAASVEAPDLETAKARLAEYVEEAQENGAPEGVIPLCTEETLRLHVRLTPDAIADTNNWESDDVEIPYDEDAQPGYGTALPPPEGLTGDDVLEYLQNAGHCPFCKSVQIEGDSLEVEGDAVYQDVRCLECDARWQDEYHLKNLHVLDRPSAEPHADGIVRCTGCGDDVERQSTCRECRQCTSCCSCNT